MVSQAKILFANDSQGTGTPAIVSLGTNYLLYTCPPGKEVQMRIKAVNRNSFVSANVAAFMWLFQVRAGFSPPNSDSMIFNDFIQPDGKPIVTDWLYLGPGDEIWTRFDSAFAIVGIIGDGFEITP